jgi:predicted ATP-grasp superfamily ATP-dependent carboligase
MPAFADIPEPGQRIKARHPVLSLFARGGTLDACQDELRRIALDLDHRLFGE